MKPTNKLKELLEKSEWKAKDFRTALRMTERQWEYAYENPKKVLTLKDMEILAYLLDTSLYEIIVTVLETDAKNLNALKLRFVREYM